MSTIAGKRPFASGRWTSPTRSTPSLATMLTSDSVVGVGAAALVVVANAAAASRAAATATRTVFTRGPSGNVSFVHVYDGPGGSPARPQPSLLSTTSRLSGRGA